MTINERIENLIEITKSLSLANPHKERLFKIALQNLETLKKEFSSNQPDKKKINELSYGIIRLIEQLPEFEKTSFGEETSKLLIAISEF